MRVPQRPVLGWNPGASGEPQPASGAPGAPGTVLLVGSPGPPAGRGPGPPGARGFSGRRAAFRFHPGQSEVRLDLPGAACKLPRLTTRKESHPRSCAAPASCCSRFRAGPCIVVGRRRRARGRRTNAFGRFPSPEPAGRRAGRGTRQPLSLLAESRRVQFHPPTESAARTPCAPAWAQSRRRRCVPARRPACRRRQPP